MCTLALPLTPTVRSGMDEKQQAFEADDAYEPPAVVEVGSLSSLTGADSSTDDVTTVDS
jgi:hypothetical protein